MAMSVLLIVLALASPWIAPQDPLDQSFLNAGQGPSAEHWFGTDAFGRDVFSRVLVGARVSLTIGIVAPLLAAAAGVWLGMIAGYFGGWTDRLISRASDLLMSFPSLLLGVMIAAALGPVVSKRGDRDRDRVVSRASCGWRAPRRRWCAANRSSTRRSPPDAAPDRSCCVTCCRTSAARWSSR